MALSTSTLTTFPSNPGNKNLFSRSYAVAIGPPKTPSGQPSTSALQYSNVQAQVNGQVLPSSPLRIAFDITKQIAGTPNTSKFEFYNLSSQTRSLIQSGFLIQLQAGYQGLMNTIFIGNVNEKGAKSERKGADIITSIECSEGASSIIMARLDKSYPGGTTLSQVLQDVAQAMNVNSITTDGGVGSGIVVGIPSFTYGRGLTVHGACRDTLDKILKPFGLRWLVQNGNLNIIPVRAYNGTATIVLNSGTTTDPNTGVSKFDPTLCTGLIGTPSVVGQYTEFTALLNPNIVPGCQIQLICENTTQNGYYKVNQARYVGDTHESKWQVECQGTKLTGAIQNLPVAQGFNYSSAVTTSNLA